MSQNLHVNLEHSDSYAFQRPFGTEESVCHDHTYNIRCSNAISDVAISLPDEWKINHDHDYNLHNRNPHLSLEITLNGNIDQVTENICNTQPENVSESFETDNQNAQHNLESTDYSDIADPEEWKINHVHDYNLPNKNPHLSLETLGNTDQVTENLCNTQQEDVSESFETDNQNAQHNLESSDITDQTFTFKLFDLNKLDYLHMQNIFIDSTEFKVLNVPGDGRCFFHCLSLAFHGHLHNSLNYRKSICRYLFVNWELYRDSVMMVHEKI
jgi:hypothetical protein